MFADGFEAGLVRAVDAFFGGAGDGVCYGLLIKWQQLTQLLLSPKHQISLLINLLRYVLLTLILISNISRMIELLTEFFNSRFCCPLQRLDSLFFHLRGEAACLFVA